MNPTIIRNYKEQANWRRRFGMVQLLCPHCDKWFTVPKDVKIDDQGHLSDTIYHFCDDDHLLGWSVLAWLEGWKS